MRKLVVVLAMFMLVVVVSACGDEKVTTEESTSTTVDYQLIIEGQNNRIATLEQDLAVSKNRAQEAELSLQKANDQIEVLMNQSVPEQSNAEFLAMLAMIESQVAGISSNGVEVLPLEDESGFSINILGDVLFDSGKSTIRKEGKTILNALVKELKNINGTIRIDGHTDNVKIGRPETKARFPRGNWQLGAERALTVLLMFKDKGISEEKMYYTSWGEFSPKSDNKISDGRRQNRRVEIVVILDK